jgi:hypothetical protein
MNRALADSSAVNPVPPGWRGTRRFVPPTVSSLLPDTEREAAAALEAARASGVAEGQARGWAEGREAGLRDGEAKAKAELEGRIAELGRELAAARARSAVAEALESLLAARAADRRALEADCRAAIAAALGALFPVLLPRGMSEEVGGLIAEALAQRPADCIRVRAHPASPAASLIRELAAAAPSRLVPEWHDTMGPAAVEIAWADGGVAADWGALLARVLAVIDAAPAARPDRKRTEEI